MSGPARRTERDRRRRSLGQNFLVDRALIADLVGGLELDPGTLVLDVGAGRGALTLPLARAGAEVWAVEPDPAWAERLRAAVDAAAMADRVRVVPADLARLRFPRTPYRVVANPPFGLTTELLRRLLDDPERGPFRADLIVQREVARKHSSPTPTALSTASWAPWWEFRLGRWIERRAFRPVPSVDAAVLTIVRRDPPVLPPRLAPGFRAALRPSWEGRPAQPG